MHRLLQLAFAVTVGSVVCVTTVAAQSARFGVGGGLIAPLSTYKDNDKAGWLADADVEFAIPLSPVGGRVDGFYGETKHKDIRARPGDGKNRRIRAAPTAGAEKPGPRPLGRPGMCTGG